MLAQILRDITGARHIRRKSTADLQGEEVLSDKHWSGCLHYNQDCAALLHYLWVLLNYLPEAPSDCCEISGKWLDYRYPQSQSVWKRFWPCSCDKGQRFMESDEGPNFHNFGSIIRIPKSRIRDDEKSQSISIASYQNGSLQRLQIVLEEVSWIQLTLKSYISCLESRPILLPGCWTRSTSDRISFKYWRIHIPEYPASSMSDRTWCDLQKLKWDRELFQWHPIHSYLRKSARRFDRFFRRPNQALSRGAFGFLNLVRSGTGVNYFTWRCPHRAFRRILKNMEQRRNTFRLSWEGQVNLVSSSCKRPKGNG